MNTEAFKWLREQIEWRLRTAKMTASAQWTARDGDLYAVRGDGGADDQIGEVWSVPETSDGEYLGDAACGTHIALNDPQDVIARCEAELAILGEHYIFTKQDRSERYEEFSIVTAGIPGGAGDQGMGCVTCHYTGFGAVKAFGICRTVKAVASGYRHRDGYAQHWGEA